MPLLLSSKRLSPDPILSKSARAELNLSWCDSVRCTFTWKSIIKTFTWHNTQSIIKGQGV